MNIFNDKDDIHRGHKEARRALMQWVNYTRTRAKEVVKDCDLPAKVLSDTV